MPISQNLLGAVVGQSPAAAWRSIIDHVWTEFSSPLPPTAADSEVVNRDRGQTELDNVLSGSAWDLWQHFDAAVPKASQGILDFWSSNDGGRAVLILDGLSMREVPWVMSQALNRGYTVHRAEVKAAELPAETTPFAKSLGFSQRSSLENNGAGTAHKLKDAFTLSSSLPWKDCVELVGSDKAVVFWHHWPDERLHELAGPGQGVRKLAKETQALLVSDDFWTLVERLATGRRLVITSDHGYAACGEFTDLDKDQSAYMKSVFKSGRSAPANTSEAPWVPPIDLKLTNSHGTHQYVLGRRKWKSSAGYPTLQHGGLSLLEVFVPFFEMSK